MMRSHEDRMKETSERYTENLNEIRKTYEDRLEESKKNSK